MSNHYIINKVLASYVESQPRNIVICPFIVSLVLVQFVPMIVRAEKPVSGVKGAVVINHTK